MASASSFSNFSLASLIENWRIWNQRGGTGGFCGGFVEVFRGGLGPSFEGGEAGCAVVKVVEGLGGDQ